MTNNIKTTAIKTFLGIVVFILFFGGSYLTGFLFYKLHLLPKNATGNMDILVLGFLFFLLIIGVVSLFYLIGDLIYKFLSQ